MKEQILHFTTYLIYITYFVLTIKTGRGRFINDIHGPTYLLFPPLYRNRNIEAEKGVRLISAEAISELCL